MYDLIAILLLLAVGYFTGQYLEKRHYKSIFRREAELRELTAVATKFLPETEREPRTTLVVGNCVISVDYFKRFVAGLRNLVGGRIITYETLVDRARREAVLRMKEQARSEGAALVFNVKIETSSISKGRRNTIGSIEVLAYGTALMPGG